MLVLAVPRLAGAWQRRQIELGFRPAMPEFLADVNENTTGDSRSRLKGKIVVVRREECRLDPLHFRLPDELRAEKPEEVGTVVGIEERIETTTTPRGGRGREFHYRPTVIDRDRWRAVGVSRLMEFDLSSLPFAGQRGDCVVEFLSKLPRG